jgi:hypothetical protein
MGVLDVGARRIAVVTHEAVKSLLAGTMIFAFARCSDTSETSSEASHTSTDGGEPRHVH